MKEYFDRLLLIYKVRREQEAFETEVRDVFGSKIKSTRPLYILIAISVFSFILLITFFATLQTKKNSLKQKEEKVEVVKVNPQITKEKPKSIEKATEKKIIPIPQEEPVKKQPSVEVLEKREKDNFIENSSLFEKANIKEKSGTLNSNGQNSEVIHKVVVEITAKKIPVYTINDFLSNEIGSLEKGTFVELLEEKEGWYKVRDAERKIGWIEVTDGRVTSTGLDVSSFNNPAKAKKEQLPLKIKNFLELWIKANESKDINAYMNLYSSDTNNAGLDYNNLKKRNTEIFKNARFILVGVKNISIEKSDKKEVTVSFTRYFNNSDNTKTTRKKTMVLRREGDSFKIYRES
ncbi:MAG: SH3 domain-containing protein [Nitrospinae bacterium]|nr:SH3 domain-containing protein [Nitrospinota bacterium]